MVFQLEISSENQYSGHLHDCKLAAEHNIPGKKKQKKKNTAQCCVITESSDGFWD